jgi:hypothetical protein
MMGLISSAFGAGVSHLFAGPRRVGARQFAGAAIFTDRDKGELGLRHFDPLALSLAQDPDLDVERDRGPAGALEFGVAAHRVADMHRLKKGDVRDRNRHDPPAACGVADIFPAESIKAMIQPPKMSPLGLQSAGIARVRDASSPLGSVVFRRLAVEGIPKSPGRGNRGPICCTATYNCQSTSNRSTFLLLRRTKSSQRGIVRRTGVTIAVGSRICRSTNRCP